MVLEKNKGFSVVTAFVAALICVQIFKAAGVIKFEFLFPYLVLIFFMYGFLHKYWVVGICKKWLHSEEKSLKLVAAVVAAAAVQGVSAEGAIKIESSAALISAIILILVLYIIYLVYLKYQAESGRYRFKENYAVYLFALLLAVFTATGRRYFCDAGMERLVSCTDRGVYIALSDVELLSGDF